MSRTPRRMDTGPFPATPSSIRAISTSSFGMPRVDRTLDPFPLEADTGRMLAVRGAVVAAGVGLALAVAGCSAGREPAVPAATALAPATAPTASTTGPGEPVIRQPRFSVAPLDRPLRKRMTGVTWQQECAVRMADLRLLTLSYIDFAGQARIGRMVVNRDVATDVVGAFRRMYRHEFPIRRMRLADHYDGSDMRSIKANNTSAFNCRVVPGSATWSQHAYGRAVDINPVQNPYWRPDGYVEPPRGRRFVDRTRQHQGMIRPRGVVVRAFDRIGWGWGGRWQSLKDWQHFSMDGR